jgi:hypothetical protein
MRIEPCVMPRNQRLGEYWRISEIFASPPNLRTGIKSGRCWETPKAGDVDAHREERLARYSCASAFLIWPLPRSSPSRRVAMWSKFHLYWTGMNGSGNTGRTRACHRRAYSNLDAGQQSGAVGKHAPLLRKLYGEFGLVNLVALIPSIATQRIASS